MTAESANDLECWGAEVYYGLEWESEDDLDVQQTQQEERAHSSLGTSSSAVADVPAELQQVLILATHVSTLNRKPDRGWCFV